MTAGVRADIQELRHWQWQTCLYSVSVEPSGARNTGDWHDTYFLSGCSVADGSLEAAWFISVLRRHRQVDTSRRDEMTLPPSVTKAHQPFDVVQKESAADVNDSGAAAATAA